MNWRVVLLIICAALGLSACGPASFVRGGKPARRPKYVTLPPKETVELGEKEYLMRKATLGARAERLEAIEVMERANNPALVPFLLERLQKEDDRFIQIRLMHVLAAYGDVRAVRPLRRLARWDMTRVGVEACAALYEIGDDSYMPRLIQKLRLNEDYPELPALTHRALRKITGENLPPQQRAWLNYYRTHRLTPAGARAQARAWLRPFRPPLPPVIPGTTRVAYRPQGKLPPPDREQRMRFTNFTWYDWWKPDEP